VASRLGYNALRSRRRRSSYEESAGREAIARADPSEPAGEYDRAERQEEVRRALGRMAPRNAQLLILRASDMSYKQISEVLSVKPTSVGALLGRAEAEFVRCYEAD
jgi:RNA polymerase sigma factor (sigma-70 family)